MDSPPYRLLWAFVQTSDIGDKVQGGKKQVGEGKLCLSYCLCAACSLIPFNQVMAFVLVSDALFRWTYGPNCQEISGLMLGIEATYEPVVAVAITPTKSR